MDRSLWLLIWLRGVAWARLWSRSLRTFKGALLGAVGSLVFLPMALAVFLAPRVQTGAQAEAIRLYGPLALLAYCVLNVALTSGDRSVHYTPAEVNFLFPGPYRPRQLLLYKVAGGLAPALLTALTLCFAFAHHATRFVAAYAGLFLGLELLYLFSLSVGLLVSTFGALAFTRARRLMLAGLGAAALAAVWSVGRPALALPAGELLDRAVRSPAVSALVAPFRPFVSTFTAEKLWPDLFAWGGLAALVDLAFLLLVLLLNARFLEASAAASERMYARVRRVRRGGPLSVSGANVRFGLPMVPRWGGVGPNLWRQLTTVARSPGRLLGIVLLFTFPVALAFFTGSGSGPGEPLPGGAALPALLGIALFAPTTVGYDFRSDFGRMEDLKTLPIPPGRVVLGQLLAPVLVLTAAAWVSLSLFGWLARPGPTLLVSAAALAPPVNLVLVAVENLYFLWFPFRTAGVNSFDFQAMGRQMLLLMAKGATVVAAGGAAAGLGALVLYLTGRNWPAAVAAAWVALAAAGLGLVPLLGAAFEAYDVAGDAAD